MKFVVNFFCLLLVLSSFQLNAQNFVGKKKIIDSYNQVLINKQAKEFRNASIQNKQKAIEFALDNNIDLVIENKDGSVAYLEGIDEQNNLLYITTFNEAAASTSNVQELYEEGSLGLSLNGSGILAGVWDDGRARSTHQDLTGRVMHMDDADESFLPHTTHVTGTMIGSGIGNPSAKGMAFGGSIQGWDFFEDIPEMQTAAGQGMIVSNHSYGTSPAQAQTWQFGAYLSIARSVDLITNSAPYYLPVFAAGNSRNNSPSHNPSKNGFDLLLGRQVAKNILTVANCQAVNDYQGPESVELWITSSWGPTDDLRIKPDITAKGRQTLSTFHSADNAYGTITGTSMASPVVAGTIMLLQELHDDLYDDYMLSHEVRALLAGTALPAGESGAAPDVKFGFGLLDASAAAKVILNSGFTSFFENISLENNQTYTETFSSIGGNIPLEVTIAWNDPAGFPQENGVIDQDEARLINDLDIRIFDQEGNEFFPYYILPFSQNYATASGDNTKDNIEKIHIPNPTGDYTIQVSHKGSLVNGDQDFAIVATGVNFFPYNVFALDNKKSVCSGDEVEFEFEILTLPDFSGEVVFELSGLPDSINSNLSSTTASSDATITLSLDNLASVLPGEYEFIIEAIKDELILTRNFSLTILEDEAFDELDFIFPPNQSSDIRLNPNFRWTPVFSAQEYLVELAKDINFQDNLQSTTSTGPEVVFPELEPETTYFWRVAPINDCLEGDFTTGSFSTETIFCQETIVTIDTPIIIDQENANLYEASIFVEDNFVDQISKLRVHLNIAHQHVGDLLVRLVSPEGTEVILLDQVCQSGQDINVIFDDSGEIFGCNPDAPTISGVIQAQNPLSHFINEEVGGEWKLIVEDLIEGDGGMIFNFGLEFCDGTANLSVVNNSLNDFKIYPNPAQSSFVLQADINEASQLNVYDIKGRLVKSNHLGIGATNFEIDIEYLRSGIYIVELISGKNRSIKKLIKH